MDGGWVRSTLTVEDGTNIGVVHFSPNARTHWHRHPGGQFLFGVSGRGRVRSKGDTGHALEPGDVINTGTPAGVAFGGPDVDDLGRQAAAGGRGPLVPLRPSR